MVKCTYIQSFKNQQLSKVYKKKHYDSYKKLIENTRLQWNKITKIIITKRNRAKSKNLDD